jgi:tetratricopeptide (TPR) repeat protein
MLLNIRKMFFLLVNTSESALTSQALGSKQIERFQVLHLSQRRRTGYKILVMKLKIESYNKNQAPLHAIFIKGDQHLLWLQAAQKLGYKLKELRFYALPGTTPNSLWGCLLVLPEAIDPENVNPYPAAQWIEGKIFIPEFSRLQPQLSAKELSTLLGSSQYLLHPELGFVKLEAPVNWAELLNLPKEHKAASQKPADSIRPPSDIKSFEVEALEPDDIVQMLQDAVGTPDGEMPDGPLNAVEKMRLQLYKSLFKEANDEGAVDGTNKTGLMRGLESLGRFFSGDKGSWAENWKEDFERLQERNKNALDRLLKMLKENPEEALKYAPTMDNNASGRGGMSDAEWELSKIWGDLSIFGESNRGGSGAGIGLADNAFFRLQEQYRKTAEELRQKGAYKKAAFVYMKLLKNYWKAAEVLEEGHYYKEAAAIYLKYLKDKKKAAEAYVKANMISKAIELYLELGLHEKAGDLYLQLNKEKEAMQQYQLVLDQYLERSQYLLASFLLERKMNQPQKAQEIRLEGWRKNYDAYNCLNNYFNAFEDADELMTEILRISEQDCFDHQIPTFTQLLKMEYGTWAALQAPIRRLAFELISKHAASYPNLVQQLQHFKPEDKKLIKDLWRFKAF